MSGDAVDGAEFKGFSKYFNSTTNLGRATAAKITYGAMGLVILYLTLKPKAKK